MAPPPAAGPKDDAASLSATRLVLRPLANPLSLGFLGVFVATMMLAVVQLGWVPPDQSHVLALAIVIFTVPVQLIACAFGFLTRDMVAATGMGVQAGIWGTVGVVTLRSAPGSTSAGLGVILVMGAVALSMPAIGGITTKLVAGATLFTTAARWGVTAGYELSGGSAWKVAAGAVGVLLALGALYASLAFELEDQQRRTVLPTLRRRSGRTAMVGGLAEQVDRAVNEAGVRKQL